MNHIRIADLVPIIKQARKQLVEVDSTTTWTAPQVRVLMDLQAELILLRVACALIIEGEQLPKHLQDDAPAMKCSLCGRTSVDSQQWMFRCGMTQPDNTICQGVFDFIDKQPK